MLNSQGLIVRRVSTPSEIAAHYDAPTAHAPTYITMDDTYYTAPSAEVCSKVLSEVLPKPTRRCGFFQIIKVLQMYLGPHWAMGRYLRGQAVPHGMSSYNISVVPRKVKSTFGGPRKIIRLECDNEILDKGNMLLSFYPFTKVLALLIAC